MTTLEDFAAHGARAGLFLDFDGTLSPIVSRPEDARPSPEVPDLLATLGRHLALVAVVSGRSAHQLVDWLGADVEIWGLHGAERTVDGQVQIAAAVLPYIDAVRAARDEVLGRLDSGVLAGCTVEDKGAIIALHYRTASEPIAAGRALRILAEHLAEEHELVVGSGRMVLELRPPIEISKAQVVAHRSREEALSAACFVGDDAVDIPAFGALDALQAEGVTCLRVAVASDEAPPALIERADLVVPGPDGVVRLLSDLLRVTTEG